ncbi:trypsin-like serine peptidase [Streptomyces sp. NPDC048172]|uniref:trypsin-like serine peptidase n=1 Tax=Streptomyces sp. NPDC048172 TaxID=3365505 RepID=UPI0037110607
MRRAGRVSATLATLAATALLPLGLPGNAAAASDATDYWTAERMRDAVPLEPPVAPREKQRPVPRGEPHTFAPSGGLAPGIVDFPQPGGPWKGGGAVVKTSGKLFVTIEGKRTACSADAVTSRNRSTVITAGHCVKWETWHENLVFVPGYHDGKAPYGKWKVRKALTTPQWEKGQDLDYDAAAVVVAPRGGKRLTDVVGGQGLSFNGAYGEAAYSFGFPLEPPYDGEKLIYCSGGSFKDPTGYSSAHGMSCNQTPGSSGGPWFQSFDERTGKGLQMTVNSFSYSHIPGLLFGPYFGDEIRAVYERAQHI